MSDSIKNLRITFWGTQGSLQYFPSLEQVEQFADLVAMDAIQRTLGDIASRNGDGRLSPEDILGGPAGEQSILEYMKKLGRTQLPVYGGETTCAAVETADGHVLIIDGGSGIRHFARSYVSKTKGEENRELVILGTHDHLDHRIGLPFSAICFAQPSIKIQVYGNYRFLAALDERFAVFSKKITEATHRDDPLDYRLIAADFVGTQIVDPSDSTDTRRVKNCGLHDVHQSIEVGKTKITPFPVYHASTPCFAYKFEHGDAAFVYCTDHELRHGDPEHEGQKRSEEAEQRVRDMCRGIDAAYFDGQYLLNEYLGKEGTTQGAMGVPRIDWGHSCIEDVIERADASDIPATYIGHHDPEREWSERMQLDQFLQQESQKLGRHIELAKDRMTIDL